MKVLMVYSFIATLSGFALAVPSAPTVTPAAEQLLRICFFSDNKCNTPAGINNCIVYVTKSVCSQGPPKDGATSQKQAFKSYTTHGWTAQWDLLFFSGSDCSSKTPSFKALSPERQNGACMNFDGQFTSTHGAANRYIAQANGA